MYYELPRGIPFGFRACVSQNVHFLKRYLLYLDLESLEIRRSGFDFKSNISSPIWCFSKPWHSVRYVSHHNAMTYDNFRSCCWKNDKFSFQIEASHWHIGLKWLCQPEIGYTTLHFFQINTLVCTYIVPFGPLVPPTSPFLFHSILFQKWETVIEKISIRNIHFLYLLYSDYHVIHAPPYFWHTLRIFSK